MPVNLPSLTELQNAQFIHPMYYDQVQKQIGLGNQFAEQGLEKGAADLQQQVLANLFAEQNNPQRVEQQRLQNEGLGYDNQSKGVKARTDVALEGESREAKRAEMLKSASEDDLKRLMAQAEAELLNPDPQVKERAQRKLDGSWGEIQRRNKEAARLKETELIVGGRKAVAETNADARRDVATTNLEGNKYRADVQRRLAEAKAAGGSMNLDKTLADAYRRASEATDPEEKSALVAYAQGLQDIIVTQKQALAGTKPDLNQLGVPTLKLPSVNVPPTVKPPAQTNRGGDSGLAGGGANDRQNILLQELKKATDPVDIASLKRELKASGYKGNLDTPAASGAPAPGTVYKGYRFKGGNPADKSNWEKV